MTVCELVPHPDFASSAIRSITVEVERPITDALLLRYRATGSLTNILVPEEVEPGFQDALWRKTCFEAFLGPSDQPAYLEVNLSPSGRYAAYHFDNYRQGMRPFPNSAINRLGMFRTTGWIELAWLIQLSGCNLDGAWKLGLSAVIEECDGTKSYWALAHAPGPPDFHNRDCFIATLPAPDPS